MRLRKALLASLCLYTFNVYAATTMQDINVWLDVFVASCVGSGSKEVVSGSIGASGEISLRRLSLAGKVGGDVRITKESYRLLSEGISNKISGTAADQADKVRVCLEPMRKTLLNVMNHQLLPANSRVKIFAYILSPEEERVMQALARLPGEAARRREFPRLGFHVPVEDLSGATGLQEIRLRSTLTMLKKKRLVRLASRGTPTHATLTEQGDRYVVEMDYAR